MENIVGPVHGFYVAIYAWAIGDQERFCSYAKVFRARPASYWDAQPILKLFGGERHGSPEDAIAEATRAARHQIKNLAPRVCSTFGLGSPYFDLAARSGGPA